MTAVSGSNQPAAGTVPKPPGWGKQIRVFFSRVFSIPSSSVLLISCVIVGFLSRYIYASDLVEQEHKHEYIIALLVIVNFLLVTFNTVIFLFDTLKASEYVDKSYLEKKVRKTYDRTKKAFLSCYLITLLISVGIPACYFMQVFDVVEFNWNKLFLASEWSALLMFLLFILADFFIKELFKFGRTSNETKLKEFKTYHDNISTLQKAEQDTINSKQDSIQNDVKQINCEVKFLKYAIPLIDVTGFVGISLIFILTRLVFCLDSMTELSLRKEEHVFGEGLAIGAIAFHIFFTQINFVILKMLAKEK